MTAGRIVGAAILALTALAALEPLVGGVEEVSVPQHHLLHAALVVGAVVAGVLLSAPAGRAERSRPGWIVVAFVAPIAMMALMWPSELRFCELHPWIHVLEHLGIIAMAFVCAYAGERFASGIGWAAGGSALVMSLLAVGGFGVEPPSTVPVEAALAQSVSTGLSTGRGAAIFTQYCMTCHGAAGVGGAGPSLKNERARKNLRQTIVWIENPAPPMPAFYPQTLSAADVGAVAAYVNGL